MTLVQKSVKGITFTVNHNTYTAVHSGIMEYDGIDGWSRIVIPIKHGCKCECTFLKMEKERSR